MNDIKDTTTVLQFMLTGSNRFFLLASEVHDGTPQTAPKHAVGDEKVILVRTVQRTSSL